jgi:hypothetical protein
MKIFRLLLRTQFLELFEPDSLTLVPSTHEDREEKGKNEAKESYIATFDF